MQWAFTEGKRKTKSSIHIPDVPIKQSFSRKLSSCGKRTREFRRQKQTKKLTCEIRASAEEIVPSFGLINLSAALQGIGASAGITQCSSLKSVWVTGIRALHWFAPSSQSSSFRADGLWPPSLLPQEPATTGTFSGSRNGTSGIFQYFLICALKTSLGFCTGLGN